MGSGIENLPFREGGIKREDKLINGMESIFIT
jgi:hypothetical protein